VARGAITCKVARRADRRRDMIWYARPNTSKYRSQKCEYEGKKFDSKKEMLRYIYLSQLEKAGEIKDLRCQVRFELLPSQRIEGKVVERPVYYIADFVYTQNGEEVVEDTKGMRTREYVIKRKLMLQRYGIRIIEF